MTEPTARRPSRRAVVLTLLALSLVIELFAFKALSRPKQVPLEVLGLQIVNDSGPAITAQSSDTSRSDTSRSDTSRSDTSTAGTSPSGTAAMAAVGVPTVAPGASTNAPSTEKGTQAAGIGGVASGPVGGE